MEQIDALERRIAAALDRIDKVLALPDISSDLMERMERDRLAARAEAEAARTEVVRLSRAVEDEGQVTGQIRARNEALNLKVEGLQAEVLRLKAELGAKGGVDERHRADLLLRDSLTAQLRRVNSQLRQNNLALREAVITAMPDPHLVNKAMLTELESIRASREAERAEIDTLLGELRLLLDDGAPGAEPDRDAGAGRAAAALAAEGALKPGKDTAALAGEADNA